MSLPVDIDVRQKASQELGASFTLTAGAGSGKTSVLVARVVALLQSGVHPSRIAAITFTEKAAGELEERVRDELETSLAADPKPVLQDAIRELDQLTLSTIHSFCQSLLVSQALAARWAPDTELNTGDAFGQAYGAWRAGFAQRHPALDLALRLSVSEFSLREGAARVLGFRDLALAESAAPMDAAAAHRSLKTWENTFTQLLAPCQRRDTCKLAVGNAPFHAMLRAALAMDPLDGVLHALSASETPKRSGGSMGDWGGGATGKANKTAFLEHLKTWDAWKAAQLGGLHAVVIQDLREHFVPQVTQIRIAQGQADFDDLLFRARELLIGHPQIRPSLAQELDALLIDEVQDTDPIQAEIATLLSRDPSAEGPWNAHPPQPGRLFAVGDPKQSIYRFRRADVATWMALREVVTKDGEALELQQNFRSVPGIVGWVNHSFQDMPGYLAQTPWRGPGRLEPVVQLDTEPELAPAHIASYLCWMKAQGAEVIDRESGETRPLRWGDVMLLVPSWAPGEALRSALVSAGIPVVVEGGSSFFQRDEVRLGMAALACLDEPADTQSTALVLRGLFGLSFAELAAHAAANGSIRYTLPEQPPGPVGQALEALKQLHRLRGRRSWVHILDHLLELSQAPAVWALSHEAPGRRANLEKLRALIRQEELGADSPSAVVTALEKLAKDADEADLSLSDAFLDAVRITTVFKAKGLEAPVVVLAHSKRSASPVYSVVDRERGSVAIKLAKGLVPPDWDALEAQEKEAAGQERRRWMYVAATRARDQLVVVRADKWNLLEHLQGGLCEGEHDSLHTLADEVMVRVLKGGALPEPAWLSGMFPESGDRIDAALAAAPSALDHGPQKAWEKARRDARIQAKRRSVRWRSVQQLASRGFKGSGSGIGREGGVIVHDVMQRLDLSADSAAQLTQMRALLERAFTRRGPDASLQAACLSALERILAHPVLADAQQAEERWQETPFSMVHRGTQVTGVIDLCFPEDAERTRWVVVDWKTDQAPEGSPQRAAYERQLALYAKALLQTVLPCESVRTVLVGPHPELPAAEPLEEVIEFVHPALARGVQALVEQGMPVPTVLSDLGEPVIAQAELAWPAERLALCLDLLDSEQAALAEEGWTVLHADSGSTGWPRRVLAQLKERFGIGEDTLAEDAP